MKMHSKTKSIFITLGLLLTYWLLMSFFVGIFFGWWKSYYLANYIGRFIYVIPFLILLFWKTDIDIIGHKKVPNNLFFLLLRLVLICIVLVIIEYIYNYFFGLEITKPASKGSLSLAETAYISISVIILSPITEELFFRRWMVEYLQRANVKSVYIMIITTILFFIPHINTLHWHFPFDCLLFGVVMYFIYNKYQDVRYCISVHMLHNLITQSINFTQIL